MFKVLVFLFVTSALATCPDLAGNYYCVVAEDQSLNYAMLVEQKKTSYSFTTPCPEDGSPKTVTPNADGIWYSSQIDEWNTYRRMAKCENGRLTINHELSFNGEVVSMIQSVYEKQDTVLVEKFISINDGQRRESSYYCK